MPCVYRMGFSSAMRLVGWVSASGAAKQEIQISACYGIYDSGGAIDFFCQRGSGQNRAGGGKACTKPYFAGWISAAGVAEQETGHIV